MSKKIKITAGPIEAEAELNDTRIAQEIYKILPIEAEGNFWGNEIYFEIPVEMENENPTANLKVGDLAYWSEGNSFCIFYGRTPASTNEEPKPASPVTIIGRVKGKLEELKELKEARIKIIRI